MGTPKRVVAICDDDDEILEVISKVVRNAGHSCFTAHGYAELASLLGQLVPDLLLCDIRMPGQDGLQIAEKLQKLSVHFPILLMTAYNSVFYKAYAPYVGVVDVISKPIDFDNLLMQIEAAIVSVSGTKSHQAAHSTKSP
jgi:DNA-binding NtrC family response regulator